MLSRHQHGRDLRRLQTGLEQLEDRRLLTIDMSMASAAQPASAAKAITTPPLPPLAYQVAPQVTGATVSPSTVDSSPVSTAVATPTTTPGSWTLLTNPLPNFDGAQMMLLMPDGSLMVHGGGGSASPTWYKLAPDANGGYVGGTWSSLASMNVGRLYFASDVLPDNRVFVTGGEYTNVQQSEANTGEIYDPLSNTWTNIPDFPLDEFGDGMSVVLPDGRILAGYIGGPQTFIYDPVFNNWAQTGTKLRSDSSTEETWVKLPDNSILSYDISASIATGQPRAQRYIPATSQWVDAGTLPAQLSSSAQGYELGAGLLLPDGRVFLTGANGNTAFYHPDTNTWTAGPVIPNGLAAGDAPAAMLPNGDVLMAVSPPLSGGQFPGPTTIYEFDPTTNVFTDVTPSNIGLSGHSFTTTMLVLPTGQVALCNDGSFLDLYTPVGNPDPAWAPTITNIAYNGNNTFTLTGTQLNGISEGASYGDDAQMSSNYPIIRLTNYETGQISYARAFNWSSTGVATGDTPVTVQFSLPPGASGGTYLVTAIANGIASNAVGIGMFVLAHSPGENDVVATQPTDFQIEFSGPVDPATLDAADLTVNGIAADSVTSVDAEHYTFHFNASPVTSKGLQTMAMAGGAVLQAGTAGTPLQPFTGTFRYDPSPLTVTSIEPASGSTVELPLTNLLVHLSEPYDPASIDASDLLLSQGHATSVSFIDDVTISFAIAGVTTEGPLSVHLAAGAMTDGFGDPSATFDGDLTLDFGTVQYPSPMSPLPPAGGQVFDPPVNGYIGPAGDTDSFTINVPAGQTISVVTETEQANTLQPQISLVAPGGATIALATAASAGKAALINSVPTTVGGIYTVVVTGANSTTGFYQTRVVVNAALEAAQYGGSADNSRGTAQSLDSSFIDLGGGITRAAVVGQAQKPHGQLPDETEPNNTLATANDASGNFVASSAPLYQLAIKGVLSAPGDTDWINVGTLHAGDTLSVSESGTGAKRGSLADSYLELYRGSSANPTLVITNDDGGPGFDSFINSYAITTTDTYYIHARSYGNGYAGTYDLAAYLQSPSVAPGTGTTVTAVTKPDGTAATATDASQAWRPIDYTSATNGTDGDADFYRIHVQAGDVVSVLVHSTANTSHSVGLYNAAGILLASEDGESFSSSSGNSPLYGYLIPATGDYFIDLQGAGANGYQVQVLLSSTTTPPPPIVTDDYYAFSLAAGESVSLALAGLEAGEPHVELQDFAGNVLAPSQSLASNLSSSTAVWIAPSAGMYYAHVYADDTIDYNLVVNRNATFDSEPNNDPTQATPLDGTFGALGYLNGNLPPLTGQFPFVLDSALSYATLSGILGVANGIPLLEQAPGSLTAHYSGQINVDRETNGVSFSGGSDIGAIAQPGLYQPGDRTADYAANLIYDPDNPDFVITALLQNVALDVRSGFISADTVAGGGESTQSFDVESLILSLTSGLLAYEVPGLTSGISTIAGLSQTNQSLDLGTMTVTPDHLHVVIPIHFATTLNVPVLNVPIVLSLDGQLVGDYASPGPIDATDYYSVPLQAGQSVSISTSTPFDVSSEVTTNLLDPALVVLDPLGNVVATDDNSAADGKNAALSFVASMPGTYRVGVRATSGEGEYVLHVEPGNLPPVAAAGGPYVVTKGSSVTLDASASHDPNVNDLLSYSWDINGDGVFGDAVGVSPTLSWAQLQALGITLPATYNVQVEVSDGTDTDVASTTLTTQYATIAGRHIFYNNSAFDGKNPAATVADDNAIAPDKSALLPDETASFANYTSYSRGINGIMVDIAGLQHTLNSSDFEFFVGNLGNVPSDWSPGPAAASISVRGGNGDAGSQRVSITWTDNSIQKQWLLVRVIANDDTGLAQDDFFYFGNAIGDTGNSPTDTRVNATDQVLARHNQTSAAINPAPLDDPYDFDRDRNVNATDQIIARRNQTAFDALQLFAAPDYETTAQAINVLDQSAQEVAALAARGPVMSAAIVGPSLVLSQEPQAFTLTVNDSNASASGGIFSYSVDWGDGSSPMTYRGPSGLQVAHVFAVPGLAKVRVSTSDDTGPSSAVAESNVTVTNLMFLPNQQNPALLDLVYSGSAGDDQVRFDQVDASTVRITESLVNGQAVNNTQTYSVTGRVIARGNAGNDTLIAAGLTTTSATLDGGAGSNTLYGGAAGDILIGGSTGAAGQQGNNTIVAGNGPNTIYGNGPIGAEGSIGGNNLIVGGVGNDTIFGSFGSVINRAGQPSSGGVGGQNLIVGNGGQDTIYASQAADGAEGGRGSILIAGTTSLDADALETVLAEWTSTDSLVVRQANILGTPIGANRNGDHFLIPGLTVFDDGAVDRLFSDSNGSSNWLFDVGQATTQRGKVSDLRTSLAPRKT